MPFKPRTAAGYNAEQAELVVMICRYVSTILSDYLNEIVVVGGLVPSLIIDQTDLPEGAEKHVGTNDLDIGLSIGILDEKLYQEITERMRTAGFQPDINEKGNPTNQRWQITSPETGKVTIDFLIPPTGENDRGGRIKNLEDDFAALIAPGLNLAFEDFDEINLDGPTIKNEEIKNRKIRVCGPGAYVVLKAYAFFNRGENKDAYDLYYVIRNYGTGPEEVADRFLKLGVNEHCAAALQILRDNFFSVDSVGVKRAVEFIIGEDAEDENLAAEVMGFLNRFINHCRK